MIDSNTLARLKNLPRTESATAVILEALAKGGTSASAPEATCPGPSEAGTPREPFRNTHLSFSRLSRFDACPLSFKFHYVDKLQGDPGVPLRFGVAVHQTNDELTTEIIKGGVPRRVEDEHAFAVWQRAWARNGLSGVDLFAEGLDILRQWLLEEGVIDPENILGVEQKFSLNIGRFEVIGAMDRVNKLDDETVEIVDWKTNRMLYTREEVEDSLQMSIYAMAAKKLYPWAKNVKLTFRMLRHGVRLETSRTDDQLATARRYVEMLGEQTETATEFPARLNTNCSYCDHKSRCPAYAEALTTRRDLIPLDMNDLEAVAREREQCANVAKAADSRKKELEKVLKARLEESESLTLGGHTYQFVTFTSYDFPVDDTIDRLATATKTEPVDLRKRLTVIDNTALNDFLKERKESDGKAATELLRLRLEAVATPRHGQRFYAKAARR